MTGQHSNSQSEVSTLGEEINEMCEAYRDDLSILLGRAHKGLTYEEINKLRSMTTALIDSLQELVGAFRGEHGEGDQG